MSTKEQQSNTIEFLKEWELIQQLDAEDLELLFTEEAAAEEVSNV